MSSFRNKTINGIKWSFIDNLANSGITFLVGLLLARILSPAEFGIIGYVTVFIAISNTIIEGGLGTALIRKTDADDLDNNTIFYSNIVVSVFLIVLLLFFSETIAGFFKEAILADILPVMSIILLINSLSIIQRTLFVKTINFKTQAIVSLISSVGSGVIGVIMAFMDYGVWSLVFQQLSRQLLITIFYWIWGTWRPRMVFSFQRFKNLFGFGSKVLIANLINTFYQNIFYSLIGKFYSTEQLGKYTRAEQFNGIFTNNLTMIIQKVSFPSLSSIQDDAAKLNAMFRKSLILSSMITFMLVGALAAMAKPLIVTLIGVKWLEAAEYLQIISVYGVLYPLSIINLNMLNIRGRSDLFLKLEVIKKFLFIPVFLVGFYFELKYMLWAAVLYYYVEYFFNSYYAEKYFYYGTWKQIKDLLPVAVITLIVSGLMWTVTLSELAYHWILIIQIAMMTVLTPLLYEVIRYEEFLYVKQYLVSKIKSQKV